MPVQTSAEEPTTAELKTLAVAPFGQWKYENAYKAMQDVLPVDFVIRKGFCLDGDHWQSGAQWVGPGDVQTNQKIEKQFAPEDAVGEVLSNIQNAFSEPQVGSTPTGETNGGNVDGTPLQRELQGVISGWWDRQRLQEHIQERQRTTAWAGWAGLRLWIPWRYLDVMGGTISFKPTSSIEDALAYIHVMAPLPNSGAIIVDSGTQDRVAVYLDKERETDGEGKETVFERAELVYLDPDRLNDKDADTIIRYVYSNDSKPAKEVRLKLGGRLTVAEITGSVVITESVLRTQRQLNLLTTLVTRIAETAAFRERYTKNAKPQGVRIPYTEGATLSDGAFLERDEEGNLWQVIPQPRTLGASTTTELIGLPKQDGTGANIGHETPDIFIADPVDPTPYINAGDAIRRRILRMCSQGHLGGVSNAESSGIAYEQARSVFEKDLNKRRISEEGMLRELITTALAMAELISGKTGYFTDKLRISVDQHVNAGPRSPDLVRLDLEAYEGGIISQETAMARYGVEDVEAEVVRVRQSTAFILSVIEKATNAGTVFSVESMISVMVKLGVPTEVANLLKPAPTPTPTPTIPQGA